MPVDIDPILFLVSTPDAAERHERDVLDPLVESMRNDRWKGCRLLVEEVKGPGPTWYVFWTGSHRVHAAREAGLPTVPCLLITQEEADEAFSKVYSATRQHECGA